MLILFSGVQLTPGTSVKQSLIEEMGCLVLGLFRNIFASCLFEIEHLRLIWDWTISFG